MEKTAGTLRKELGKFKSIVNAVETAYEFAISESELTKRLEELDSLIASHGEILASKKEEAADIDGKVAAANEELDKVNSKREEVLLEISFLKEEATRSIKNAQSVYEAEALDIRKANEAKLSDLHSQIKAAEVDLAAVKAKIQEAKSGILGLSS